MNILIIFMIFIHERQISFEKWQLLDFEGILAIEKLANDRQTKQTEKWSAVLVQFILDAKI